MQNNQIETLARQIHTLRRQRGSALKLWYAKTIPACVPRTNVCFWAVAQTWLSRGMPSVTLPDAYRKCRGQQFNRHVPEDISTLLSMTQPMKLRGYQKWDTFCDAVGNMMNNTLLPADGKGVMVALRPVPGSAWNRRSPYAARTVPGTS